jgi:hypothetical protein
VVARVALPLAELRPGNGRSALRLGLWLHARGLPVQPPASEVPARAYERAGHVVTFWRLLPAGPGDPAEAGRALRAIQEALGSYEGELERCASAPRPTATPGRRGRRGSCPPATRTESRC